MNIWIFLKILKSRILKFRNKFWREWKKKRQKELKMMLIWPTTTTKQRNIFRKKNLRRKFRICRLIYQNKKNRKRQMLQEFQDSYKNQIKIQIPQHFRHNYKIFRINLLEFRIKDQLNPDLITTQKDQKLLQNLLQIKVSKIIIIAITIITTIILILKKQIIILFKALIVVFMNISIL